MKKNISKPSKINFRSLRYKDDKNATQFKFAELLYDLLEEQL